MKLLRSTKSKITKDENGENVSTLEITEVIWIYCYFANNNYQQNSKVMYSFVPNELLVASPKYFTFLKAFDSDFSNIEVGLLIKILNH